MTHPTMIPFYHKLTTALINQDSAVARNMLSCLSDSGLSNLMTFCDELHKLAFEEKASREETESETT